MSRVVGSFFKNMPNRVKFNQEALNKDVPSFKLKPSDKLLVSVLLSVWCVRCRSSDSPRQTGVLFTGVTAGVVLALYGQVSLWLGLNKIERN